MKKRVSSKVKSELQRDSGSQCPFCKSDDVGRFVILHIDDNSENTEKNNLMLVCRPCSSKITSGIIPRNDVYIKKLDLSNRRSVSPGKAKGDITVTASDSTTVVGDGNTVNVRNVKSTRRPVQKYPPGCIGYDSLKSGYISHLIQRYNEYKEHEAGKGKVIYSIFGAHLKKRYKIGATRTIYNLPDEKFNDLQSYIKERIDGTKLGRKLGSSHKNYSTFEEYCLHIKKT